MYECNLCGFTSGSRKIIRKHARVVHYIKGLDRKGNNTHIPSDISASYTRIEN